MDAMSIQNCALESILKIEVDKFKEVNQLKYITIKGHIITWVRDVMTF